MNDIEIDGNSGVHAIVGFDFQRNSCVYIFLESYNQIKDQNYFIMLEHYDDIVFGFLTDGELSKVDTYQAKKSSTKWTNSQLFEIIEKIANSGIKMSEDAFAKNSTYSQNQNFISNNIIHIEYECSKTNKKKSVRVNESNVTVKYVDLADDCKTLLEKGTTNISFSEDQRSQFNNLNLAFIDFGKTPKSQREQLIGKFKTVFNNSIADHEAALDFFVLHLKEIEGIYNQGGNPQFAQEDKKLYSNKINEIIRIITTKSLAIEFCRKQGEQICEELAINVVDALSFNLHFENSLDKFKDLSEGEHQKIYKYIELQRGIFINYNKAVDCISALLQLFMANKNSTLGRVQLVSAISAAYYLILNQK